MNQRRPPRIASFLLDAFCPRSEAIAGDLIEAFHHGRTPVWYWRQTISALAIGYWNDLKSHKLLALRAVITGWTVLILFSLLLWNASLELVGNLMPVRWHAYFWTHPPLVQLLLAGLASIVYAASGWLVARLHRRQASTMLLVYIASLTVWRFPGFGDLLVTHHRPHFLYSLGLSMLIVVANSASIAVGGFIAGRGGRGSRIAGVPMPSAETSSDPVFDSGTRLQRSTRGTPPCFLETPC